MEDGFNSMDFQRVTEMLCTAFWSPGIQIDEVIHGATNSALVVGAFDSIHRQIGYARAISDKTRFAYILDVIVDEGCRKQGIGQGMINYLLAKPELKAVYCYDPPHPVVSRPRLLRAA